MILDQGRFFNKSVKVAVTQINKYRAGKITEGEAYKACRERDKIKGDLLDLIELLGTK